jgi:hypothetical protein
VALRNCFKNEVSGKKTPPKVTSYLSHVPKAKPMQSYLQHSLLWGFGAYSKYILSVPSAKWRIVENNQAGRLRIESAC